MAHLLGMRKVSTHRSFQLENKSLHSDVRTVQRVRVPELPLLRPGRQRELEELLGKALCGKALRGEALRSKALLDSSSFENNT